MRTLPKTLLALAIVGFAISLTGPGSEFADGVIKPFSAICFNLYGALHCLACILYNLFKSFFRKLAHAAGLVRKVLVNALGGERGAHVKSRVAG